jgi:putative lipoprotein
MMKTKFHMFFGAVALAASCMLPVTASLAQTDSVADGPAPISTWVQVQGSATYLQRIGLIPGSKLLIVVEDVGRADAPSRVIAARTIRIKSVPTKFALRIPRSLTQEGNDLNLCLAITARGKLRWVSDSHIPIASDPFSNYIDVGEIVLTSAL